MPNFLKKIVYSLPFALLALNIKKIHLHLLLWLVLLSMITGGIGKKYGFVYLFLDPEYLNIVDFRSFFFVGIGFGIFLISYNITCYILFSVYYPFVGGAKRAFLKFCTNNAIIPLVFAIVYIWKVVVFQSNSEFRTSLEIITLVLGFVSGTALTVSVYLGYFFTTNIDVFKIIGLRRVNRVIKKQTIHRVKLNNKFNDDEQKQEWPVEYYLENPLKLTPINTIGSFDIGVLRRVLSQNQLNAVLIQIVGLVALILLGLYRENPYFQIPAGASLFLLFSFLVMLSGAFSYWLRGWQAITLIGLIFLFGLLEEVGLLKVRSSIYGINYAQTVVYSNEHLRELTQKDTLAMDKLNTEKILNNWKFRATSGFVNSIKPKLVMVNTSGGGLRASLFTFRVLQLADSLSRGDLMQHTVLMSGASGGILGASYYRALQLDKVLNKGVNPWDAEYVSNISHDMLNETSLSIAVNDIFIPFQTFTDRKYSYSKDRAYALESAINRNTKGVLDKRLGYYRNPERAGLVPMIVYTPTIANDGRRLYISPQPIAYLCTHYAATDYLLPQIDGVEFRRLFAPCDADSLRMLSAIRMSATFPYITPNATLPSNPSIQVMDAGARDNLGAETTIRFLYENRKWILENTSGVIFLNIRDTPLEVPVDSTQPTSVLSKATLPIGSFFGNWERFMQYEQENLYQYLSNTTGIPMQRIVFQYKPEAADEEVSISWHLTTREKKNILKSVHSSTNTKAMQLLIESIK